MGRQTTPVAASVGHLRRLRRGGWACEDRANNHVCPLDATKKPHTYNLSLRVDCGAASRFAAHGSH